MEWDEYVARPAIGASLPKMSSVFTSIKEKEVVLCGGTY